MIHRKKRWISQEVVDFGFRTHTCEMAYHVVNSKHVPLDTRDGCGLRAKGGGALGVALFRSRVLNYKTKLPYKRTNRKKSHDHAVTVPTINVPPALEKVAPNNTGPNQRQNVDRRAPLVLVEPVCANAGIAGWGRRDFFRSSLDKCPTSVINSANFKRCL
jgi:hypothetical protein